MVRRRLNFRSLVENTLTGYLKNKHYFRISTGYFSLSLECSILLRIIILNTKQRTCQSIATIYDI
jgi:hypothetical protein